MTKAEKEAAVTEATSILKARGIDHYIVMVGDCGDPDQDKMSVAIALKGSVSGLTNLILQGPTQVLSHLRKEDPDVVSAIELAALTQLVSDLQFEKCSEDSPAGSC